MNLVRWQPRMLSHRAPRHEGLSLLDDWDGLMSRFFNFAPEPMSGTETNWTPRVDVREEQERYLVEVDLPGMNRENVEVTMDNDVLTISGERKFESEKEDEKVYRRERFCGKFTRSMTFPGDVDFEKIEAAFKDGVLRIEIPKSEQAKTRQIEIK